MTFLAGAWSSRVVFSIGVSLACAIDDVGEYLADASALEAAGVDSLWLDERSSAEPRAGDRRGLDPWPLLAALAAVTHRVRLGTAVSAIASWPPVLFAAVAASLDRLCRGRLVVGAGIGEDPVRFIANGVDPSDRERRLEEFVAAARHLWSGAKQPFGGNFYELPGVIDVPRGSRQGGPPVFIGGLSDIELALAARIGDGLIHAGGTPKEVAAAFAHVLALRAREAPAGGFELWARVPAPSSRAAWREALSAYEQSGATGVIVEYDPRILDLLRNPDLDDDRRDLVLAQG